MEKLYLKLAFFLVLVAVFAFLYKSQIDGMSYEDAFHISVSFQTFTGSNLVDLKENARKIATVQMLLSYILVAYAIYDLNQ